MKSQKRNQPKALTRCLQLGTFLGLAAMTGPACAANPIENLTNALKDPSLQGKVFESNCSMRPMLAIASGLKAKSSKSQYHFTGGSGVVYSTIIYSNTSCSGDALISFEESGTLDIKDENKTKDDARFIDFNFTKLSLALQSDAGVDFVNRVNICGARNMKRGEDREVTDQSRSITCYGSSVPRRDNNVYRLEGNTLYLGTGTSDRDADGRPTSVDRQEKYVAG